MADLGQLNFLIVDKNEHMLEIVETILRGFGARKIARVNCVQDTLKYILENNVDIVICDFMYGQMDVLDVTKFIRFKMKTTKRYLPIILLTSDTTEYRIAAARDAGVTGVACKPVSVKELFRRLATIVDSPRDFVLAPNYVGPDRRRKVAESYKGKERRACVQADQGETRATA